MVFAVTLSGLPPRIALNQHSGKASMNKYIRIKLRNINTHPSTNLKCGLSIATTTTAATTTTTTIFYFLVMKSQSLTAMRFKSIRRKNFKNIYHTIDEDSFTMSIHICWTENVRQVTAVRKIRSPRIEIQKTLVTIILPTSDIGH